MSTKREQILSAIKDKLDNIAGVNCYRSRTIPFKANKFPAIVVEPLQDVPDNAVIPMLDWSLIVQVKVFTKGENPDQAADTYIQQIHELLMSDLSLSGLSQDIQPIVVDYEFMDAEYSTLETSMKFKINYRTYAADLSA